MGRRRNSSRAAVIAAVLRGRYGETGTYDAGKRRRGSRPAATAIVPSAGR